MAKLGFYGAVAALGGWNVRRYETRQIPEGFLLQAASVASVAHLI